MSKETTTIKAFPPLALAIMGGKDALPEKERGPMDTVTGKAHPLYDERLKLKLTPEWVENIRTGGVKEIPNVVLIDGVPFVVNGRQRIRAARVAGLDKVLCRVTTVDSLGMLRDMIALNVHQEDPVNIKIAKLQRLIANGGTPEEAAVLFATRPATIKAWLQYDATALPEVKKAVNTGKIPQTTGADIARLPAEKQPTALAGVLKVTPEKSDRKERKGHAAKSKRAIARAGGKGTAISDKKTLKKFLEAVEGQEHPKNAKGSELMWWSGVEAALHLVLGSDGGDPRLDAILASLDEAPAGDAVDMGDEE